MSEDTVTNEFESSLDVSMDEVKEPGNVPTGTWMLRGFGYSIKAVKDNDGRPQDKVSLGFDPYQPGANVDATEVEKAEYKGKKLWRTFFVDASNRHELVAVLNACGISGSGRTIKEAVEQSFKGSFVYANIGLGTQTNKQTKETRVVNTLSDFAAVNAA